MIGLFIALIGITLSYYFNLPKFDAIASMGIGVVLVIVAIWLAYESKKLLIGEAASPDVLRKIRATIKADERIADVKNILTMHVGPQDILVNLYVDFIDQLTSSEVEQAVSELENQVKAIDDSIEWVFIAAKSFSKRASK